MLLLQRFQRKRPRFIAVDAHLERSSWLLAINMNHWLSKQQNWPVRHGRILPHPTSLTALCSSTARARTLLGWCPKYNYFPVQWKQLHLTVGYNIWTYLGRTWGFQRNLCQSLLVSVVPLQRLKVADQFEERLPEGYVYSDAAVVKHCRLRKFILCWFVGIQR